MVQCKETIADDTIDQSGGKVMKDDLCRSLGLPSICTLQ